MRVWLARMALEDSPRPWLHCVAPLGPGGEGLDACRLEILEAGVASVHGAG